MACLINDNWQSEESVYKYIVVGEPANAHPVKTDVSGYNLKTSIDQSTNPTYRSLLDIDITCMKYHIVEIRRWPDFMISIMGFPILLGVHLYSDGLVREIRNSLAKALELRLVCTNPSILERPSCRILSIKVSHSQSHRVKDAVNLPNWCMNKIFEPMISRVMIHLCDYAYNNFQIRLKIINWGYRLFLEKNLTSHTEFETASEQFY